MILCSGAFDGLHAGHVRYLQAARRLDTAQTLRVAVSTDGYIRTAKGREPYWPQVDRAATVCALACVDEVVLQEDDSIAPTIRALRPAIFVKGPDWRGVLPVEVRQACADVGTSIEIVSTAGRHTSEARR